MNISSSTMPLDKFGRHFHGNRQKNQYNFLKSKGQLFYFTPLNIPCPLPNSRYIFPLDLAHIVSAVKISTTNVEVQVFVNDIRIYSLDALKNMTLKRGDTIDISHTSEEMLYVQMILKCSVQAE